MIDISPLICSLVPVYSLVTLPSNVRREPGRDARRPARRPVEGLTNKKIASAGAPPARGIAWALNGTARQVH